MRLTTPLVLFAIVALIPIVMLGWPTRGFNRRREIISLLIRIVLCLILILALAGLELKDFGKSNSLAVVFLLDISDSIPPDTVQAGLEFIREALQHKRPDDQSALIVFGRDSLVERAMTNSGELNPLISKPVTNQSDLTQAVNLGLALYPSGAARRMVILSDGAFTTGNTSEALRVAAASSVDIVGLPLLIEPDAEILVDQISVPHLLRQGDRFDMSVTLTSTHAQVIRVRVFADGNLVFEGEQEVYAGDQTFNLALSADHPGFTSYMVSINGQSDHHYQNNQLSTYTQIIGAPKVLIVAPETGESMSSQGSSRPDEFGPLSEVLEANGYQTDHLIPELFPADLTELAGYASVIFVDVPARRLSLSQMTNLQTYVRDLGGGLVVIGGPTSYGVGGYFRTPLEETLPVDMQIQDERRRPTLAMVFILDRSGSMSETSGGPTKLELAKEAVLRSIDLLNPLDKVGVIAFDDAASWVAPIAEVGDGSEIKAKVASIGIGGGTDILAGIQAMAAAMPSVDAGARHVILLTDGGADPSGIPELVERLYTQSGITMSTIGVGRDAAPFLAGLAELGGGRYHFAENPGSIPNIYTEETALATRAYLVEEPFIPELKTPSTILNGIDGLPELLGYVGTSAKETAQTILVSHRGDPILASWRYGLGKSIAFTSDASGRWAQQWLGWADFPAFWSQVVRFSIGDEIPASLDVQTSYQDGAAHIRVEGGALIQRNGIINDHYLNNYDMQANIIHPDGETLAVRLLQVAPGRYETEFTPEHEGVYLIRIVGEPPDLESPIVGETAGWTLDYSPEYRRLKGDPDSLARLVFQAGGRLASQDPGAVFTQTLPSPAVFNPVWQWLLGIALFLLPFDIAIRRLAVTKSDLQRAYRAFRQLTPFQKQKQERISESTERMRGLLAVKQQSEERFRPRGVNSDIAETSPDLARPRTEPDRLSESRVKGKKLTPPGSPIQISSERVEAKEPASSDEAPGEPASSVSKLLAKKRSQRKSG
jgi:uncharacterized membrane protein